MCAICNAWGSDPGHISISSSLSTNGTISDDSMPSSFAASEANRSHSPNPKYFHLGQCANLVVNARTSHNCTPGSNVLTMSFSPLVVWVAVLPTQTARTVWMQWICIGMMIRCLLLDSPAEKPIAVQHYLNMSQECKLTNRLAYQWCWFLWVSSWCSSSICTMSRRHALSI